MKANHANSDLAQLSRSSFNKSELPSYLARRILWAFGKKSPYFAYLKVTKRCNLDCHYCPWHGPADDFAGELDTETWKGIIQRLCEEGVKVMVFEGGEPTLRKDLADLLSFAASLGAFTVVGTNGHGRPWRFRPRAFAISLDGPESYHDSIRGAGSFKTIVSNLRSRPTTFIASITVLSDANVNLLEPLLQGLQGLVDAHLFTFQYPYGATTASRPTTQFIVQTNQLLTRLKADFPIVAPTTRFHKRAKWSCHQEVAVSIDHLGNIENGCFVTHAETRKCEACSLGCFQTLSSLHDFNFDAWFGLYRHILRKI